MRKLNTLKAGTSVDRLLALPAATRFVVSFWDVDDQLVGSVHWPREKTSAGRNAHARLNSLAFRHPNAAYALTEAYQGERFIDGDTVSLG